LIVLCPSLGLQRRVNGASNEQARILLALILFAVSFTSRVLAQNEDKRAFGVLPNYRTAEASVPFQSLTTKQKFSIATKDSIDYPVLLTTAFLRWNLAIGVLKQ
jgi:hypothetical protein